VNQYFSPRLITLPGIVLDNIFMLLCDPVDIFHLFQTCKRFYSFVCGESNFFRSERLWRAWCQRFFDKVLKEALIDLNFQAEDVYYPKQLKRHCCDEDVRENEDEDSAGTHITLLKEYLSTKNELPSGCNIRWLFYCLSNRSERFVVKRGEGQLYIGEMENGQYNGNGILVDHSTIMKGRFVRGELQGSQSIIITNNTIFKGDVVADKDSVGICYYKSKKFVEKYVGGFKFKLRSGFGTYYYSNGDIYKGNWKDGHKNGQGTYIWSSGSYHHGLYVNSNREGHGKFIWTNGDEFEGTWKNDQPLEIERERWMNNSVIECIKEGKCTRTVKGLRTNKGQYYYSCARCAITRMCESCNKRCAHCIHSRERFWSSLNNCLCNCSTKYSSK